MKQQILEIDPSEEIEFEVFRHNIGLVPIIGTGVIVVFLLLFAPVFFRSESVTSVVGDLFVSGWFDAIIFSLLILVVIMTLVAVHIYRRNELVITNENLKIEN